MNPFKVNVPLLYPLKTLVFIALLGWLLPYFQETVYSLVMSDALAPVSTDSLESKFFGSYLFNKPKYEFWIFPRCFDRKDVRDKTISFNSCCY